MRWRDSIGDAMRELKAIRGELERLGDRTAELTALRGQLEQSQQKIAEKIEWGVLPLREENREVRRRQDRMISDLNDTRGELRHLLDLVEVLRPLMQAQAAGETPPASPPEHGAETHPSSGEPAPAPAVTPDDITQGGTVENSTNEPQPASGDGEPELALKTAIEAVYRAEGSADHPACQPSAAAEDPEVAHGVLLLKAAGVASAELIAHLDTWEWLLTRTAGHDHFRIPPFVEDSKAGRVRTVLSGRSLIALLIELWNTRSTASALGGDWPLAQAVYLRIASGLADVTGQGTTIRIVLDDGLPPDPGAAD
ncbi:hypothetical protein ABZ767_29145 [Streptomyces pseudogriseolus]|uniref:hypothetical protein n=2 Tax=Streptomyces pseudogriseolus TaxID=36817 RepID=UPI00349B27F7